jgi:glutaredoxin
MRLYVKSVKTVTGSVEAEHEIFGRSPLDHPNRVKVEGKVADGTFRLRQFAVETEPKYDYILPEEQEKATETVKRIARKYGLEVEVVDLTKENALRRILQKKRGEIRIFPTLIAGPGERIEGNPTERQVEELFSRLAEADWQEKIGAIRSS